MPGRVVRNTRTGTPWPSTRSTIRHIREIASPASPRNQQTARQCAPTRAPGRNVLNQSISSANHKLSPSSNRPSSASRYVAWKSPAAVRRSGRHTSDGTVKRMNIAWLAHGDGEIGDARGQRVKASRPWRALHARHEAVRQRTQPAHAYAVHVRVAKSAMIDGVAVSNPTTSSMPASSGSAMLNSFDTIPITTSFAPIPIFWRYARRAWTG